MRADAVKNRRAILDAASLLFAERGLGVPVQEVALRAGVGNGTVTRHFPTKDALVEAALRQSIEDLVATSRSARATGPAGPAFFALLDELVAAGCRNRALPQHLSAALASETADRGGADMRALCDELDLSLTAAQAHGAVRTDLVLADVEALLEACMRRPGSSAVVLSIVKRGVSTE